jgi:hypothetical protein
VQVAVDPILFTFYSSGIISSDNRICLYGPDVTNHAMFLVGYQPAAQNQAKIFTREVTLCRSQEWYDEFSSSGCSEADEFLYLNFCCRKETYDSWFYANGKPWFKVQNTWGTEWGDDGFGHFLVEGSGGSCEMNMRAFWVEP